MGVGELSSCMNFFSLSFSLNDSFQEHEYFFGSFGRHDFFHLILLCAIFFFFSYFAPSLTSFRPVISNDASSSVFDDGLAFFFKVRSEIARFAF